MDNLNFKNRVKEDKSLFYHQNRKGIYGTELEPRKSLHTFFRNQNKFEVSTVAILDRKAAILIRICITIISGLIIFNDYIENTVNSGSIISLVLLVGLLTSLLFAIFATKPSTNKLMRIITNEVQSLHPRLEENTFYVWDTESLDEYESAMSKVIRSQDLQVGNQVRANFILGKYNAKNAQLIDYSYTLLLVSFLASGLVFILSNYFYN